MGLLIWIIFGALVGWVASLIMRTDKEQGALANIIVGVVGALVGGFLARLLGADGISGFNPMSFIVALGGAIVLIAVVRMFSNSTTEH